MYEQLFETKALSLLMMVLASAGIGAFVARASLGLRSMAFNFVPSISLAFFSVALLVDSKADRLDLVAGLLFEGLVLAIFIRLFADIFQLAHRLDLGPVSRFLSWSVVAQIALGAPQLSLDNFGIFAEGSRIGYLGEAAWAKYLTYAVVILNAFQAALLARLVTLRGRVNALAWAVVLINAVNSTLSGSKGAVFLWIVSVVALIDWNQAQLRWRSIAVFSVIAVLGFVGSALFVSDVLGIETTEFINLAASRFFITNDARALAFDMRSGAGGIPEMLRESFRSVSGLFGWAAHKDPLGAVLYEELLGSRGDIGANASLTALATFYMPIGTLMFPLAVGVAGLLCIAALGRWLSVLLGGGISSLLASSATLVCVSLYSQDFLAFQLAAPMAVLICLAMVLLRWQYPKRVPSTQC